MKLLSIAAAAATLTACGQTGDLYLPESRQGTVVTRPAPADAGAQAPAPDTGDAPPAAPTTPAAPATPPGAKDKKNGAAPK